MQPPYSGEGQQVGSWLIDGHKPFQIFLSPISHNLNFKEQQVEKMMIRDDDEDDDGQPFDE